MDHCSLKHNGCPFGLRPLKAGTAAAPVYGRTLTDRKVCSPPCFDCAIGIASGVLDVEPRQIRQTYPVMVTWGLSASRRLPVRGPSEVMNAKASPAWGHRASPLPDAGLAFCHAIAGDVEMRSVGFTAW
jgi:hypothetical protein